MRVVAGATAAVLVRVGNDFSRGFAEAGGTFHYCCAGETTWHGFAEAIFDESRRLDLSVAAERVSPIRTVDYPAATTRPVNSRMDCGKIATRFGITAPHWRNALGLCLDDAFDLGRSAVGGTAR